MAIFIIQCIFLLALLLTAVFSFARMRTAVPDYLPMLLFFIVSFVLETLFFVLGGDRQTVRLMINIQLILSFLLVLWQARQWKLFRNLSSFKLLIGGMMVISVAELLIRKRSESEIPWFTVLYALTIVFIAIELLKTQFSNVDIKLMQNTKALFSMGLIFYYSFTALLDLFMLIGQTTNQQVLRVGYLFVIALGLITNFLYLRAVLCIPKHTN